MGGENRALNAFALQILCSMQEFKTFAGLSNLSWLIYA
jgi:hypothetical protein